MIYSSGFRSIKKTRCEKMKIECKRGVYIRNFLQSILKWQRINYNDLTKPSWQVIFDFFLFVFDPGHSRDAKKIITNRYGNVVNVWQIERKLNFLLLLLVCWFVYLVFFTTHWNTYRRNNLRIHNKLLITHFKCVSTWDVSSIDHNSISLYIKRKQESVQ